MKIFKKIFYRLKGVSKAFIRFPLTGISLFLSTIITLMMLIGNSDDYIKLVMTLIVSAFLFTTSEVLNERFFDKVTYRILLYTISIVLSLLYYFSIRTDFASSHEVTIRTGIILFALFTAFILIPTIKSEVTFNESFIIAFKAFFISIFFTIIIYLGMSIIFLTVNNLLFEISSKLYGYSASIIFMFFAPMYFLSIIPVYLEKKDELSDNKNEKLKQVFRLAMIDKYLEVLISYIIIPLTSIFTVILLIYIVKNVGGNFFSNSLLEPMIVSYSITVIMVYLLSSNLNNKVAVIFRKVFPKLLIPIILLQIIASIMAIGDTGITHGRYFVILYGIFSILTGAIFSLLPVKKNGYVATLLIVFSLISILPPIDAFHVSKNSQARVLEQVLTKNNMLVNNEIIQTETITKEDKEKIINATRYLYQMNYLDEVTYLSKIEGYPNYNDIFGFNEYEYSDQSKYINITLLANESIEVSGYDVFLDTYLEMGNNLESKKQISEFDLNGAVYRLSRISNEDISNIVLTDNYENELIHISMEEIIDHFKEYSSEYNEITKEEATISKENDKAKITVVIKNLNYREDNTTDIDFKEINCYILIDIK